MHAAKISATREFSWQVHEVEEHETGLASIIKVSSILFLYYSSLTASKFWALFLNLKHFTKNEHYLSTFSPYFEHFLTIFPTQSGQAKFVPYHDMVLKAL